MRTRNPSFCHVFWTPRMQSPCIDFSCSGWDGTYFLVKNQTIRNRLQLMWPYVGELGYSRWLIFRSTYILRSSPQLNWYFYSENFSFLSNTYMRLSENNGIQRVITAPLRKFIICRTMEREYVLSVVIMWWLPAWLPQRSTMIKSSSGGYIHSMANFTCSYSKSSFLSHSLHHSWTLFRVVLNFTELIWNS